MKPRRVIVTLELETDAPMEFLCKKEEWEDNLNVDDKLLSFNKYQMKIYQVQVNVVVEKKRKK